MLKDNVNYVMISLVIVIKPKEIKVHEYFSKPLEK